MSREASLYARGVVGCLCLLVIVVVHGCLLFHVHHPFEIARLSM